LTIYFLEEKIVYLLKPNQEVDKNQQLISVIGNAF